MNRKYHKQLKKAIANLPEQSPDDKVWHSIEAQLEFREQLTDAIQQLPIHEPDEQIWQNIAGRLPNSKVKRWLHPHTILYLSTAASIAIIVVFSMIFTREKKETITESVEISKNEFQSSTMEADSLSIHRVLRFIEAQCKSSTYLCNAPEFNKMRQQLIEVNCELKKVNKIMGTLGDSPSIIQTKTKLENMQAQLIKDIVKQVTS